jgi:hypothetical protein
MMMVAFAETLTATTVRKFRDPEAAKLPIDDRTRLHIVDESDAARRSAIVARIPEAADLDLIAIKPPKEWLDEKCGY